MRPLGRLRLRHWIGMVAATTTVVLGLTPTAGAVALEASAKPVPADRWTGSVCGAVSTWLKAKGDVEARVSETLGDLGAGDVRAKAAQTRLTRANARAVAATDRLIDEVRSAGTPSVNGGKQLASDYLKTLSEYRDAYKHAGAALADAKTGDTQQFLTAAQQVNGDLAGDLAEVGTDPIEELRAVPDLTPTITAVCGDVASYLVAKIDPACRTTLDTTQRLPDLTSQYLAAAPNSPQESSLFDQMDQLVFGQFRPQLAACNVNGLPGSCRRVFQTSLHLAEAWNLFVNSEEGSPLERAQKDDVTRTGDALRGDLQGVCR
jgi:hypothetical protein